MAYINQWRQQNGNSQFNRIACQRREDKGFGSHFAGKPKGNTQYDKTIEELRDHGRAGTAQPNHAVACTVFDKMKNRNIDQLGDQKRGNTSHNDQHTLPEDGCKLTVGDQSVAFNSGNLESDEQQHKGIPNQGGCEQGEFANTLFSKILVDEVGGDKNNGPREDSQTHHGLSHIDEFAPNEFGHQGIGDKNAG